MKSLEALYDADIGSAKLRDMDDTKVKIGFLKQKIIEIRKNVSGEEIHLFAQNFSWFLLVAVMSLYDYIFLKQIFIDIFRVE